LALDESKKAAEAQFSTVYCPAIVAAHIKLPSENTVILDSHAVCVDQQFVHILFRSTVEPLLGIEFMERLFNVGLKGAGDT
jgi:hypothetical protein